MSDLIDLANLKQAALDEAEREITQLKLEVERLREALVEISKGEGRFSRDRLQHAENTIENMKKIAGDALTSHGSDADP